MGVFMKQLRKGYAAGLAMVISSALALSSGNAIGSDHQEAPGATALLAADIGDYYVWHEDTSLNLILTFGTFAPPDAPGSYNSDILYGFHFDTSAPADGVSDVDIYARFAQAADGSWGLQVTGAGDAPIVGAVEQQLTNGSATAWAGVRDDPFFFDQTGFRETVATGTISFDPTRDDVAGLNITAIAIQLPIDAVKAGGGEFETWTTTGTL